MRKRLFIAGLVITVLFSVIVGFLNVGILFWLGIPALPLIAGILMVWFSKAPVLWRIVATVSSILIIGSSFMISLQIRKAEPETFLIPDGFRGELVVFYDEPCGSAPKRVDGRRIYEIPESGVLVTAFDKNKGYLDRKFFFVSNDGTMREFPEFHRQNYETERKEWHLHQRTPAEGFTRETVGAFWSYGSTLGFESRNLFGYIVADYHYFELPEKERFQKKKQFEQNAKEILRTCWSRN